MMINNKTHLPLLISENDLTQNAVAIALTETNDIIFEVRSKTIAHQPGDICLPGGHVEPGETPEQAVLREMAEELQIDQSQIEMNAPVSIFVTGGLEIHVFLCRLYDYRDTYQPDEVAFILRVPLSFFLETKPEIYEVNLKPILPDDFPFDRIYGGRNYTWREKISKIRFYEYNGFTIWGITARIMDAFANILMTGTANLELSKEGSETSTDINLQSTNDRFQ